MPPSALSAPSPEPSAPGRRAAAAGVIGAPAFALAAPEAAVPLIDDRQEGTKAAVGAVPERVALDEAPRAVALTGGRIDVDTGLGRAAPRCASRCPARTPPER